MKVLVQKISKLKLLKVEIILGTLIVVAAFIGLPAFIFSYDATLIAEPLVLGIVIIGMLFFGLIGFFSFIYPYILYNKLPAVQAETDGEFLYIHTKKEAKIPLSSLSDAIITVEFPFLLKKEFVRKIIIYLFSEEYGDIILEVPGYGTFKMHFVAYAQETANEFIDFLSKT